MIRSDDSIIIVFKFITAKVDDSNCKKLVSKLEDHDILLLLGDEVYDSVKLFKLCEELSINLLTDINLRKSKSVDNIKNKYRKRNFLFMNSHIREKNYKQRLTIERLFSILKLRYHLENPRL